MAEDSDAAFREMMRYTVDQALFVPVWDEPSLFVAQDTIDGIEVTEGRPTATYATEWVPPS